MTAYLRDNLDGEQAKMTVDKKELRVWKFPIDTIENTKLNNKDEERSLLKHHEKMMTEREQREGSRLRIKKTILNRMKKTKTDRHYKSDLGFL